MAVVLKTPFSFTQYGGVAFTSDLHQIIEQKIIDVLVTGPLERTMRPGYGANAYGLLWEPVDGLLEMDFTKEAVSEINKNLSEGQVVSLSIRSTNGIGAQNDSTSQPGLLINVAYKIPPFETGQFSFKIATPTQLTEETVL